MRNSALHLEFERLVAASESASANFSNAERTHLADCAGCAAQVRKLRNIFALAPRDFDETVPQSATANLLNIYQKTKAKPRETLASRLAGLLVFDDWQPEFALNERLSFQDTRQFLYRAGNCDIDLRLNFADEKCFVSGQIFSENRATVKIYNAKFSLETNLNEHGEFDFPPIEQESFNLRIDLENEMIEINDIPIS